MLAPLGWLLALSGCSDESPTPPSMGQVAGCLSCDCPAGFAPDDDGVCHDVLAAEPCPAGTRSVLGEPSCVGVGVAACPEGFLPSPSGWGCMAVLPALGCTGATREVIGSGECVPIGDCSAPFPPSGTAILVDDDFGDGELDSTHQSTITEALVLAPPGAIIAIESGTYEEGLLIDKPVTLVGRCAAQVIVESPGGMMAGLQASGVDAVSAHGLTLRGHRGGVVAVDSTMSLGDLVIEDNRELGVASLGGAVVTMSDSRIARTQTDATGTFGFGAFVEGGGQLELDGVVVAENQVNGVAVTAKGSSAKLHRSIVQGTLPNASGDHGKGVVLGEGATATIVESVLRDNRLSNLTLQFEDNSVLVVRSVLHGARPTLAGDGGHGFEAEGGTTVFEDSTIAGNALWGAAIGGGEVSFVRSTLRGTPDSGGALSGGILVNGPVRLSLDATAVVGHVRAGIILQEGAEAVVDGSVVAGTTPGPGGEGIGVSVFFGSSLSMSDSALSDNTTVGLSVGGADALGVPSAAEVTRSVIQSTRADGAGRFGRAVQVVGGTLRLRDSALVENHEIGIVAGEIGTTVTMIGCVVRATELQPFESRFGHGVMLVAGAHAEIEESSLLDNRGVGLVVADASATAKGVDFVKNQIGVHVQGAATLSEVSAIPVDPVPAALLVDETCRFLGNEARIGSGAIPLPELLK